MTKVCNEKELYTQLIIFELSKEGPHFSQDMINHRSNMTSYVGSLKCERRSRCLLLISKRVSSDCKNECIDILSDLFGQVIGFQSCKGILFNMKLDS